MLFRSQDGETATQTITVNRATVPVTNELVAPMFRVSLDQDEGIIIPGGTFAVDVNKENLAGLPVNSVTLSCAAPTVPAATTSFGKSTCTYNQPGTYRVEVIVKDTMDVVIYSKAHIVVVKSAMLHIALVKSVYLDLMERLAAGNKNSALKLFFSHAQVKYGEIFTALGTTLATAAGQFGALAVTTADEEHAEIGVVRTTDGIERSYLIYLLRGEDGVWRLESM